MKKENQDADELSFSPAYLAALIEMTEEGTISQTVAKEVFERIFYENADPVRYVKEHGLNTVRDTDELRSVVEKVIADNPQPVADYKGGKGKALGFLVGQTMKAMKGKADPGAVNQMLLSFLNGGQKKG